MFFPKMTECLSVVLKMISVRNKVMKRVLFILILLTCGINVLSAQDISVKSFRLLPTDLTARVDPVTNDNGQSCALVKIVTTERGFEFDPDALGMCGAVDESHAGEVRIWLSPGSRRITIRHKSLGVLRGYEYPEEIKSACVYEMVLVTGRVHTYVEEQNRSNFLALTVTPPEAMVKIDGSVKPLTNGQLSTMLPVGEHSYELYSKLYHPKSGKFVIEPEKKTVLNLQLNPNFGFLSVASDPTGAAVFIDGSSVGTTPYTSDRIQSGIYTVQVAKDMYKDVAQQVTVSDNETTKVTLTLAPNFAEPVFTCADNEAEIWVNGEKKGTGRWSGRLPVGTCKVEARKISHRPTSRQLTLEAGDNQSITLEAPSPIVGKVSVNSTPFDADILLDGKKVGTTPEILNQVLIGSHELRIEKAGCSPVTRTVTVEEGKTAEVSVELATGRAVTLKSDPTGANIYVDGTRVGTAPYTTTLSFGTHRVKAEKEDVVKEETVMVSEQGRTEWTLNVQKGPQTETITVNGVSFTMVAVKGGTFTMGCTSEQGSDCYDSEKPAHQVTLSDYLIGETEVTQALWKAVMGSNPSSFKGDNLPVEKVSYNDIVNDFIPKLNRLTGRTFRLPTEAEWEYAARGGSQSRGYKYSGSNTPGNVAWYYDNSGSKTHPVKTKAANELGLYDMSGNVWEWCSDRYGSYSNTAQTDPTGPSSGSDRVLRGGTWGSIARSSRVSDRYYNHPFYRLSNFGFRLVMEPESGVNDKSSNVPVDNANAVGTGNTASVSSPLQTQTITVNGVSFKMVAVKGGAFTIGCTSEQGSDCYDSEKPAHQVTLSDYLIGETEVTQATWKAVMGRNPSYFKGDDRPVENVSWDDCQKFIKRLNRLTGRTFRLPTEAEWEYAARGGSKSRGYKYSGSNTPGNVAWYYDNSGSKTHPVKTKAANELGLYDMSGNVWEWCQDWKGSYSSTAQTDPAGPSSGSNRVLRGGSWYSGARGSRVSYRGYNNPDYRNNYGGFRLVTVQ